VVPHKSANGRPFTGRVICSQRVVAWWSRRVNQRPLATAWLFLSTWCLWALVCETRADEFRTWTDSTGKHKREAAFEKLEGETVHLRSKDGKEVKIPLGKLSEADQSYARNAPTSTNDPFEESTAGAPNSEPAVKEVGAEDDTESDDPNLRVVIAEGFGATVDKAKKDAYREAVRLVVGAFVDSSQLLKNDQLIEDRIITLSSAYVEKASPPLTKVSEDGLVRVKVRAWVRLTKVLETLKQSDVVLKVDNESFAAELQTKADQEEGADAIMSRVFAAYPANSFKASPAGKPEIKKASAGETVIRVGVKIEADLEQYLVVAQKLAAALGSTAREKGEFSVDGKKFPPNSPAKDRINYWFRDGAVFDSDTGLVSALPPADISRLEEEKLEGGGCSSLAGLNLLHLWPMEEATGSGHLGLAVMGYGKWEKLRPVANTHAVFLVMSKSNPSGQRTQWKWFLFPKEEAAKWFAPACKKMLCVVSLQNAEQEELIEDRFVLSNLGWRVWDVHHGRQFVYICSPYFVAGDGDWYAPSFTYTRQIEVDASEVEGLASVKCSLTNGEVLSEVWGVTE